MAEAPATFTGIDPAVLTADWQPVIDLLDWTADPTGVWQPGPYGGQWFPGGRIDPLHNLVTRHAGANGSKIALHWEGESGERLSFTYAELAAEVAAVATALRGLGVTDGDVVAFHTGWLPETVFAVLACIDIGARWSMLPISLPAEALATRLGQLQPSLLITQDGAWRHGTVIPLKVRADDALASAESVEHTIVIRRTGLNVPWFHGDHWFDDLTHAARPAARRADTTTEADATGRPIGAHLCAGHLAAPGAPSLTTWHSLAAVFATAAAFHSAVRTGGTFWCAGDVSWAVSQWHGLIGPLLYGDTIVVYEGTLDVPHHQRAFEIMNRYDVSTFVTTPSVMRTMRSWHDDVTAAGRVAALCRVVTAGEPVEPELRRWMQRAFVENGCEVVDGWGQILLSGIAFVHGGSCQLGRGVIAVTDADGQPVEPGCTGELIVTAPLPGMVSTASGAGAEETIRAPFTRRPNLGFASGDLVLVEPDGGFTFQGRIDPAISVSGQLVSLTAVGQLLEDHPFVDVARAVAVHDPEHGRSVWAAVVTSEPASRQLAVDLMSSVREMLGGLARPRAIVFVDTLDADLDRQLLGRALAGLVPTGAEWGQLRWADVIAYCRLQNRRSR